MHLDSNCLEGKASEKAATLRAIVCDPCLLFFCLQPAASQEDTAELSAFLRNSTIPHLVRKRDVPMAQLHRQAPAKVLVSHPRVRSIAGEGRVGHTSQGQVLLTSGIVLSLLQGSDVPGLSWQCTL